MQCLAQGGTHIVVKSPRDGKIRRCPVDNGTHVMDIARNRQLDAQIETVGRYILRELNLITDAHADAVHGVTGKYQFGHDTGLMESIESVTINSITYVVNGEPVGSIMSDPDIDVYPLPDGKWMMPQVEVRASLYTCEEILLAEGKGEDEVRAQMKNFFIMGSRHRDPMELISSLQARSKRLPVTLAGYEMDTASAIDRLKEMLATHGPCILIHNDMHGRILDRIDDSPEGPIFSVRDPYTGSSLQVRDHEQFWAWPSMCEHGPTETNPEGRHHWFAVFLQKAGSE